jgi:hypothetical protein
VNPQYKSIAGALVTDSYADSVISVDARLVGDEAARFLVVACRAQPGSASKEYRAILDPHEHTLELRRSESGTSTRLSWRFNPSIKTGNERHRLSLSCIGDTISASVGGDTISAADSTYRAGQHWVGVGVYTNVDGVPVEGTAEARFDNLEIQVR